MPTMMPMICATVGVEISTTASVEAAADVTASAT